MTYDIEALIQARQAFNAASTAWYDIQQEAPVIKADAETSAIINEVGRILQANPDLDPIKVKADPEKVIGSNEKARERQILLLLEADEAYVEFRDKVCNLHTLYETTKMQLEIEQDRRRAYEDLLAERQIALAARDTVKVGPAKRSEDKA